MKRFLSIFLLIFAGTLTVLGQANSGLTGVVTDQNGGVVPGVKVTLTDTKKDTGIDTVTDNNGTYNFNNLLPGSGFKLSFSASGFQTLSLTNVTLGIGVTTTQSVRLTAGQVSETVEVVSTSGDATLNTTDSSTGTIIGSRELKELPIQIRQSPAALIGLAPGAVGSNIFAGATGGNRTGSVVGSRADQGNITVDGIDVNDQATGQAFSTVANAPIDSIQEFRAVTSGPNAVDGRTSGGQVQLTTNSGTNHFHGNLREYFRTEQTAANSFFSNKNKQPRAALRRHQYGGSIGGPVYFPDLGGNVPHIFNGKDKVFFFVDLENRIDRSQQATSRTVPRSEFRNGQLAYVNNTAGCPSNARIETLPNCVSFLSTAQIQGLDPKGIGVNSALFSFINQRYPLPNDITGGNGLTTALYRWNAPNTRDEMTPTIRVDANLTSKQRVFVRTTIERRDSTNAIEFLPGDGDSVGLKDRSWSFAAGHTWVISNSWTNVITAGLAKSQLYFSPPDSAFASFPNSYAGGPVGAPFPSLSYQDRVVYTPTIRDDATWVKGQHTFQFGLSWKPIRQDSTLINDFNFVSLGLGGGLNNLNNAASASLRPSNISGIAAARTAYDTAFTYMLGRIGAVSTNFNLDPAGTPLKPGTGKFRSYAYNEYEFYFQDNWRVRSDLSLTLGVRYTVYPSPYDRNGAQADSQLSFQDIVDKRIANAAAGIAGPGVEPHMTYDLSGKANDGKPYYDTRWNNFAPRLGINWNPSFSEGFLKSLFGNRKSVIHANYSMVYDRVGGGLTFIQNQADYLFGTSGALTFGSTNGVTSLLNDPRFTGLATLPVTVPAPSGTRPVTPFVENGVGTGIDSQELNYSIDHNFRIPYSHTFNIGYQRELPGNILLDISYVGRLGRKLLVQSDAAQVMNFKDPASGQLLFDALNQLQANGVNANVPWFQGQIIGAGPNCSNYGYTSCAALMMDFDAPTIAAGDSSDLIWELYESGLIRENVGLSSQFPANAFITNQGRSDYHGGLLSLQKRFSHGYQFEVNYTYSKSLDNNSTVANTVTGGLVCDVINPDICRGPSDFDIRHIFNTNFIVDVPFGRGRAFGRDVNKWVDTLLGGWSVSGIISGRSGLPFSAGLSPGSFPIGFFLGSPAIINGPVSAFQVDVHNVPVQTSTGTVDNIEYFKDPTAAQNALRFPHHGELGGRNFFRGPWFWGADIGVYKRFKLPWSERQTITFRADAFNATNSNAFALPGLTKGTSTFGFITASSNTPREIQFALRWDF